MANLLVRGVDENLVKALKERAGANGTSAESEHRKILESALSRPQKRNFAESLADIPDVGTDSDFDRIQAAGVVSVFN